MRREVADMPAILGVHRAPAVFAAVSGSAKAGGEGWTSHPVFALDETSGGLRHGKLKRATTRCESETHGDGGEG
ncbi:hypothetical protein GCM10023160_15740 [Brachybacterium paraconglomeratum]